MSTKQYRTAMGKTVDMGALMIQNEQTRAVGNMGVNARGDQIDSINRIISKKNQQVNKQYKKQTTSAAIPVSTSNTAHRQTQVQAVDLADAVEDLLENTEVVQEFEIAPNDPPSELQGGLAAAIAKAKTVQQTKLPTLREAAKSAAGVRKL
jgi:predicted transcriptional regulator YheO